MIRALGLAVLVMAGGPALALSCLRPDVARTYSQAAASETSYIVVVGELTFDERRLPRGDGAQQDRRNAVIPARMDGVSLSKAGFTTPFSRTITLEVACFGPWCGGAKSGVPYLAFLEKRGGRYVLVADPCGSSAFAKPTKAQVQQVERCAGGLDCGPVKQGQ